MKNTTTALTSYKNSTAKRHEWRSWNLNLCLNATLTVSDLMITFSRTTLNAETSKVEFYRIQGFWVRVWLSCTTYKKSSWYGYRRAKVPGKLCRESRIQLTIVPGSGRIYLCRARTRTPPYNTKCRVYLGRNPIFSEKAGYGRMLYQYPPGYCGMGI